MGEAIAWVVLALAALVVAFIVVPKIVSQVLENKKPKN